MCASVATGELSLAGTVLAPWLPRLSVIAYSWCMVAAEHFVQIHGAFFLMRGLKQVTGGAAGLPGRGAAGCTWRVTDGVCLACSCHFSWYFTASASTSRYHAVVVKSLTQCGPSVSAFGSIGVGGARGLCRNALPPFASLRRSMAGQGAAALVAGR